MGGWPLSFLAYPYTQSLWANRADDRLIFYRDLGAAGEPMAASVFQVKRSWNNAYASQLDVCAL
jgi:hypothetical protein